MLITCAREPNWFPDSREAPVQAYLGTNVMEIKKIKPGGDKDTIKAHLKLHEGTAILF